MYFNFDTDPYSPFFIETLEIYGYSRRDAEIAARARAAWDALTPKRKKPAPWHVPKAIEPWDESQDAGLDFAQEDFGIEFDAGPGFDAEPDPGWPEDWPVDYASIGGMKQ